MKQKVTRWSRPDPSDLHLALALHSLGSPGTLPARPAVSAQREFRGSCSLEVWNSQPGLCFFVFFLFFRVFVELFNMQFVSFCRELLSEPVTWLPAAPLYNSNGAIWVVIRKPHSSLPPTTYLSLPWSGGQDTQNKDDHPFLQLQQSHCISAVYFFISPEVWIFLGSVRAKSLQFCSTPCDPLDCSPPGSSIHGIIQARILEWVAISFSRFRTFWMSMLS